MLLYWLWLHLLEDLTSGQKRALLAYFHDPEQLYRATESAYRTAVQLPEEGYTALSNKELTKEVQSNQHYQHNTYCNNLR